MVLPAQEEVATLAVAAVVLLRLQEATVLPLLPEVVTEPAEEALLL
jgi:hypothetical protein